MMTLVEINHSLFDAKILTQGAQIIEFIPKNRKNIFWSASLDTYEKGKAFRGGIPICWPWFGKNKSPSHGFARINEWKLIKQVEDKNGVDLEFYLDNTMIDVDYWKYNFKLNLTMKLTTSIELELKIESEVETTGALHSYFYVNDIYQTMIKGLSSRYYDQLLDKKIEEKKSFLSIHKQIDRIYNSTDKTVIIEDISSIDIKHINASDIVVWNPWEDGVQNINDMEENDYTNMVCIESARISKTISNESFSQIINY